MKQLHDIPLLKIVPLNALLVHEYVDQGRLTPLKDLILEDGILKNPPLVLPTPKNPDEYVVLDGATRTGVFRELAFPHLLVQVIRPDKEKLELRTWNQVVLDVPPARLLSALRDAGLKITTSETTTLGADLDSNDSAAQLVMADGTIKLLPGTNDSLAQRTNCLNVSLEICRQVGRVERTALAEIQSLRQVYPHLTALFIIQPFTMNEVITMASEDCCMPAGLTRFIVSPRAIRLNYPLARLRNEDPLAMKQRKLEDWVRLRVQERRVRYYAESTYVFDD